MTEKRFQIFGSVVEDILGIIPITLWQDKKQQEKFCAELNALYEENEQLKQCKIDLITKIDFLEKIIDGEI